MHNLSLHTCLIYLIFNTLDVNGILVSEVVIKVQSFFSLFALLLVPKDKVNPRVDVQ